MNFAKAFSPFRMIVSHPLSGLQVNAGFFNIVGSQVSQGEFYDPIKATKNFYFNESPNQASMQVYTFDDTSDNTRSVIMSDGAVPTSYSLFIEDFGNCKVEQKEVFEPDLRNWEKRMKNITVDEFQNAIRNGPLYRVHTKATAYEYLSGKFWQPLDMGIFRGEHTDFTKQIMEKSRNYKTVSLGGICNVEGGFTVRPNFDHSMFYKEKLENKCRNSEDWMNIRYSNSECGHHEFVAAIKLMEKEGVKIGMGTCKNKDPVQRLAYESYTQLRQKELERKYSKSK